MLSVRIIPCMDVQDGRVVKGKRFENLLDAGDPVENAKLYEEQGADELAFLDISATAKGRETIYQLVEQVAENLYIPLLVGGGVNSVEKFAKLLASGADKVSINSAAVSEPELINRCAARFGSQCVVAALDAKHEPGFGWRVYTHAGAKPTAHEAVSWSKELVDRGAGELLVTSMDRDGMKDGYDLQLLSEITQAVTVPVIASGGAGKPEHLLEVLLHSKVDAVLAASIFHYKEHSIEQVKRYLAEAGIEIR